MKIHSHRSPQGFTLVELLVVIAIIAVLASAGFAAGGAAIQKARKTTALATATAIESAVSNFFTEYGSMPSGSTSGDPPEKVLTGDTPTGYVSSGGSKNLVFLESLLGTTASVSRDNPRGIKFLSVREGKNKRNGIIYNDDNIQGLYDPWGNPFVVVLDVKYEEKVDVGNNKILNGRRVAVYSHGADLKFRTADDVKTWE